MDTLSGGDEWAGSGPDGQGEHLYTSERVVVSPAPGVFEPAAHLAALESTALAEATAAPGSGAGAEPGSHLAVGDQVGTVGLTDVRTPFEGILVRWLAIAGRAGGRGSARGVDPHQRRPARDDGAHGSRWPDEQRRGEAGGRVVLVTGGSRGIGLACAQWFLAHGDRVAVTSRSGTPDREPRSPAPSGSCP